MISITLVAAIATGMLMAMRGGLLSLNRTQTRLDENRRALGIQRILVAAAGRRDAGAHRMCGGQMSPFAFRGTRPRAPDGEHVFDGRRRARGCRTSSNIKLRPTKAEP